ncbi:hypothetical protein F3D3_3648 [Fusibacter sp. 3D3]|nr:hypothetical protein F3D3_3648 [Fusibacter sp. 3D3]
MLIKPCLPIEKWAFFSIERVQFRAELFSLCEFVRIQNPDYFSFFLF